MIKNTFKKLIFILSLGFVLFFDINLINAEEALPEEIIPVVEEILPALPIEEPVVVPEILKEQVVIRNGDSIVYEGFYDLPTVSNIKILDKNNIEHEIDARSVLGIIYAIDQASDTFSISNIDYNNDWDSLYLKCLMPKDVVDLCDNWQYAVNSSYPMVGMDKNVLSGSEKIYLFFGQQNRVLLNKNSIDTSEELSVTAEKYDYENNLWIKRTGVTVGVTKPDPNNPWSPNDDIKLPVDPISGVATFLSVPEGEYNIGIKEDFYWPTEKLTVIKFIPQSNGGGSSSVVSAPLKTFSVSRALDFLLQNKKSDGSYGSSMYTDWVAIASGAGNNSELKSFLTNYLKLSSIEAGSLTDYERRAMALMSLSINPYTDTEINYIKRIIDSFDGVQFGDISLENDDIFALIVLKNAGYNENDEIINKNINYIISKQSPDGSWGSVDMTAAGIQALKGFENISGVSDSILKGEEYLLSNQKEDGGFGNSFSEAWVLQSIYDKDKMIKTENYLILKQQDDGGMEEITESMNNRIWSTAYTIPAILHKSWDDILNDFSKLENTSVSSSDQKKEEVTVNQIEIIIEPKVVEKEELNIFANNKKINTISEKKIVLQKKEVEENKINDTSLVGDKENPLLASVALADTNASNKFLSTISNFFIKIITPFVWLLDKLGF